MRETKTKPFVIHATGVLLFLFIPLVLFLFLRFPYGILPSFTVAIAIMFSHRFVAIPFMNRYRAERCFWCGKTSNSREILDVSNQPKKNQAATKVIRFEFCRERCMSNAKRFFDFCCRYRILFQAGIFLPLVWYVISMLLVGIGLFSFPIEWNRFIFQFFIACSVVAISFLYRKGQETEHSPFPFPIHNLFLLGAENTLLVFRYVGIWWIAASLYFLYTRFHNS